MGVVEEMLKDAWLRVEQGALAGKQFVLYKNPTVIGSSPKCEIYLFKDPGIEPRHAAIHVVQNRREIEDLSSPQGTFLNNQSIVRHRLQDGDRIRVGKTVFHYLEKRKGRQ
jgi:pSer/pThr/pTyr-binding forkhead associated (FHA) protein